MANNGGVVKTWTANNASSVTGTYADWYSTGDTEWIIEVTGTTNLIPHLFLVLKQTVLTLR